MDDELLTPKEVAEKWLKCDIRTLRRYINMGLPIIKLSPRSIRISKIDLLHWIESRKHGRR